MRSQNASTAAIVCSPTSSCSWGVDEKTAAEDACKAEHILSEQTLEKIRERALETDAETGSAQ